MYTITVKSNEFNLIKKNYIFFGLDCLWNAEMWFQQPCLSILYSYRKGLGTSNALLSLSNTLQSVFECGQESRIVHILSATFDRVNRQGINFKLALWAMEVLCYLI